MIGRKLMGGFLIVVLNISGIILLVDPVVSIIHGQFDWLTIIGVISVILFLMIIDWQSILAVRRHD